MVWLNFLILIPVITATRRFNGLSFRSNKMEGDKPILRMSPNADYAESNSDEGTQTSPPPKTKDPTLVRDMSLLVNWLVENFSYDVIPVGRKNNNVVKQSGKPILRMPLGDTIDSDDSVVKQSGKPILRMPLGDTIDSDDSVVKQSGKPILRMPLGDTIDSDDSDEDEDEDDDKEAPEIKTTESPLPLTDNPAETSEESEDPDDALRTKHKTKKIKEEEPNPEWVKDLKVFIKDLTSRYGKHEVLERAKPVISLLQKKHNTKIEDIDVDEYGEIHITYIEKGKGKKTARKGKKSDET